MDTSNNRLDILIPALLEELRRIGLSEANIWGSITRCVMPIKTYFAERGLVHFDEAVLDEYVREVEQRRSSGDLTRARFKDLMRGADRLHEFYATGKVTWGHRANGTRFEVGDYFEGIIASFIDDAAYTDNTKGDIRWALHKYLSFIEARGHEGFDTVALCDVEAFMAYCAKHLKGGSLSNVKGYLKVFHRYLREAGVCMLDTEHILSFPITRETKISPFATAEEIRLTLAQVNRGTAKGLRDCAIIVLAATTGMRAHDIVNLRLCDIDWQAGEIKAYLSKTGRTVTLPLVSEAGEAIKAYILQGRPEADTDSVFLSADRPYRKLSCGCPIAFMYNGYQEKAGIKRTPHDGKGFHAIRRAMGRNLVISGVPITTAAQILGQYDIKSLKPYINLATEDLRQCALSLEGIEPGMCSR